MISSRRAVSKAVPKVLRSKEALPLLHPSKEALLHQSNNKLRSQPLPKLLQLKLPRSQFPLHLSSLSTHAMTGLKYSLEATNGLVEQNNAPLMLRLMKRSRTHLLDQSLTQPLSPGTLSSESFPTRFGLPGKAMLASPPQPQLRNKQQPRQPLPQQLRMSLIHSRKMRKLMPPLLRL